MRTNLTQRELAKRIGVSYLTVNRSLSNKKEVSNETRERVLREAQKYGYRKNAMARSLKLQRSFAIGMVGSNNPHGFWSDLLLSMERRARNLGYHVIICHHDEMSLSSAGEIEFLLGLQIEGLVFCAEILKGDLTELEAVMKSGIPVLLFDQYVPGTACNYLGTNSKGGARKACEYLLGLGHTRIAFVSGPQRFYTSQSRLAGYREALAAAGIKSSQELVIEAGFYQKDGELAAEKILSLEKIPTAIMAVNDPVAIGLYKKLKLRGLRIPEDISLVGYSGDEACELLSVPMTTVVQPVERLGHRAVEIVIAGIESGDATPVFEELNDELLIRDSCCPIGVH